MDSMPTKLRARRAAAWMLALAVVCQQAAAATAQVSVSALEITLVDLAPDDGQSAGLLDTHVLASSSTFAWHGGVAPPDALEAVAETGYFSREVSSGGAWARSAFAPGGLLLSGSAQGLGALFYASLDPGFANLLLAPNTGVRIRGQLDLRASATGACAEVPGLNAVGFSLCEGAQAAFSLNLLGPNGVSSVSDSVLAAPDVLQPGVQVEDHRQLNFELAADAWSFGPSSIRLEWFAKAEALSISAAVPEPGTAMLFVLGLGGAAWRCRGRRQLAGLARPRRSTARFSAA